MKRRGKTAWETEHSASWKPPKRTRKVSIGSHAHQIVKTQKSISIYISKPLPPSPPRQRTHSPVYTLPDRQPPTRGEKKRAEREKRCKGYLYTQTAPGTEERVPGTYPNLSAPHPAIRTRRRKSSHAYPINLVDNRRPADEFRYRESASAEVSALTRCRRG